MKATLRLEVERVSQEEVEQDSISECGSFSNGSIDGEGRDSSLSRHLRQGSSSGALSKGAFSGRPKWSSMDKRRLAHSASASSFDFPRPPVYPRTIFVISCNVNVHVLLHCPSMMLGTVSFLQQLMHMYFGGMAV